MVDNVQEWLQRTIAKVDSLLMEVCRKFEAEKYKIVSQCLLPFVNVFLLSDGGGWIKSTAGNLN